MLGISSSISSSHKFPCCLLGNEGCLVLFALESQRSVKGRRRALLSMGCSTVTYPYSISKERSCILPFLSFSLNFPLNHFYDYKYPSLFFHYGDTYTLKGYLFHLPVLSLPVCPFQRLNSGTVAKQLYIIAASHQLLIVPSTLALQIWTASDNGTVSTAKNTLRGFFAQQRQRH